MHKHWIELHGLDADYRIEERSPAEFGDFVRNLASHGYVGANVTMPHKDEAFTLSEPDERARAVGAANTLWLDHGVLRSTNTDVEGFIAALDASAPGWERHTREALVLGAGGAGRAVVRGLIERGVRKIHVANRTPGRVAELRARFGCDVSPVAWEDVGRLLPEIQLLANATSLGMKGQPPLELRIEGLRPQSVVADIVYVPVRTPLLAAAAARGLATSDGLDMLLHQAVRGFELWFGIRPRVTRALYDMLAADIAASR